MKKVKAISVVLAFLLIFAAVSCDLFDVNPNHQEEEEKAFDTVILGSDMGLIEKDSKFYPAYVHNECTVEGHENGIGLLVLDEEAVLSNVPEKFSISGSMVNIDTNGEVLGQDYVYDEDCHLYLFEYNSQMYLIGDEIVICSLNIEDYEAQALNLDWEEISASSVSLGGCPCTVTSLFRASDGTHYYYIVYGSVAS